MPWLDWLRRKPAPQSTTALTEPPRSLTALVAGRQRVVGVPYMLPADSEEVHRLDFQHYFLRYALRGNYVAPIEAPTQILDVGTGTARWAHEMARTFPLAQVVGLDISPAAADAESEHSGLDTHPPNYAFALANLLEGLPYPDGTFDLVHMRLMFSAIPEDRWPFVATELARVACPGGWVESVEAEPVEGAPALNTLKEWQIALTRRRGVDIMIGARVSSFLRDAGLYPLYAFPAPLPIGKHGGRLGAMVEANYLSLLASLRGFMALSGIASESAFDQMIAAAREELAHGQYVSNFYVSYGQRPAV